MNSLFQLHLVATYDYADDGRAVVGGKLGAGWAWSRRKTGAGGDMIRGSRWARGWRFRLATYIVAIPREARVCSVRGGLEPYRERGPDVCGVCCTMRLRLESWRWLDQRSSC